MIKKSLFAAALLCGLVAAGVYLSTSLSDEAKDETTATGSSRSVLKAESDLDESARSPAAALGPRPDSAAASGATPDAVATPRTATGDANTLEQAIENHEAAKQALAEAERDLDDLEREVEAVEAYVEDLVERGEDPARHAFDAMEKLNPVIDRYEARLAKVEAAEADVEETRAVVDQFSREAQAP